MSPFENTKDALQCYLEEVATSRPLSASEEITLASRIRKGDMKARAKLIEANLRFVVSIAREYRNYNVPLEDLISAGNLGLIIAAERFDATRGLKFISYAVWWIRQGIHMTLKEYTRMVRLPVNRLDLLKQISQYIQNRKEAFSPTEEEIADALGVSREYLIDTLIKGQNTTSLDSTIGDDSKKCLLEMIPDSSGTATDDSVMEHSLKEDIEAVLQTLDEREREIIKLVFGLDGSPMMTLEAIGKQFNLTRERIRQIKEKALLKLRHPARAHKLRVHAEEI